MPAPRCRPFTVLDGMILVAARAAGFWVGRLVWRASEFDWREHLGEFGAAKTFGDVHACLTGVVFGAMPVVLVWTVAWPLLGLLRPRPTLRRLCRQPGFAACVAVSFAESVIALGCLASEARGFKPQYLGRLEFELVTNLGGDVLPHLGIAVVGVWVVMALGNMARRDPGWIDRAGRALGAYWVVELVLWLTRLAAD